MLWSPYSWLVTVLTSPLLVLTLPVPPARLPGTLSAQRVEQALGDLGRHSWPSNDLFNDRHDTDSHDISFPSFLSPYWTSGKSRRAVIPTPPPNSTPEPPSRQPVDLTLPISPGQPIPTFISPIPLLTYTCLVLVVAYVAYRIQKRLAKRKSGPVELRGVELLPTHNASVRSDINVIPNSFTSDTPMSFIPRVPSLQMDRHSRRSLFKMGIVSGLRSGRSKSLGLPTALRRPGKASPLAPLRRPFISGLGSRSTPTTPLPPQVEVLVDVTSSQDSQEEHQKETHASPFNQDFIFGSSHIWALDINSDNETDSEDITSSYPTSSQAPVIPSSSIHLVQDDTPTLPTDMHPEHEQHELIFLSDPPVQVSAPPTPSLHVRSHSSPVISQEMELTSSPPSPRVSSLMSTDLDLKRRTPVEEDSMLIHFSPSHKLVDLDVEDDPPREGEVVGELGDAEPLINLDEISSGDIDGAVTVDNGHDITSTSSSPFVQVLDVRAPAIWYAEEQNAGEALDLELNSWADQEDVETGWKFEGLSSSSQFNSPVILKEPLAGGSDLGDDDTLVHIHEGDLPEPEENSEASPRDPKLDSLPTEPSAASDATIAQDIGNGIVDLVASLRVAVVDSSDVLLREGVTSAAGAPSTISLAVHPEERLEKELAAEDADVPTSMTLQDVDRDDDVLLQETIADSVELQSVSHSVSVDPEEWGLGEELPLGEEAPAVALPSPLMESAAEVDEALVEKHSVDDNASSVHDINDQHDDDIHELHDPPQNQTYTGSTPLVEVDQVGELEVPSEPTPPLVLQEEEEHPDPDLLPLPTYEKSEVLDQQLLPPVVLSTSGSQVTSDDTATAKRPAWSQRASDAPALGISATTDSGPSKSSRLSPQTRTEEKEGSLTSPKSPGQLVASLPGSFPSPALPTKSLSDDSEPSASSTAVQTTQSTARPRTTTRSPIDIALAMQLRPGLGLGADPAWMVRFLMSMFGWFVVLLSGSPMYDGYRPPIQT